METFNEYYNKYREQTGLIFSACAHTWNHQQQKIEKLEAENKKLRDCVEFYTNATYDPNLFRVNEFQLDHGKRARKCLKELKSYSKIS